VFVWKLYNNLMTVYKAMQGDLQSLGQTSQAPTPWGMRAIDHTAKKLWRRRPQVAPTLILLCQVFFTQ